VPGLVPLPREEGERVVGEVLWVDHYGNCQLNIGEAEIAALGERVEVYVGEVRRVAARVDAFDARPGAVGMIVDGSTYRLVLADVRRPRSSASWPATPSPSAAHRRRPRRHDQQVQLRPR
jgi:S-adenosylmethionine hydrolase